MPLPFSDIVIFLPGIMGSVLAKDGKEVWAPSVGAASRGLFSLGGSVRSLAIENDDPDADDLEDGVIPIRLVPNVHLIPDFWKIDGYSGAVNYIKRAFSLKSGANFFEFPYDWRRDNRATARRLARESHKWLKDWRESSGNKQAKLILICHSMGGLVSRYFTEVLEGWRDTRMIITLGTPHRGSLNALDYIANGLKKGIGPIKFIDLSELVRSFSSVYQLLPLYPCIDDGTGQYLRVNEVTNIPALNRARVANAMNFHNDIQDAFESNQNNNEYLRNYTLRAIVGTYQKTQQSAVINSPGIEMLDHHYGDDHGGDGTVPRVSAVPRTESAQISGISVAQRHSSLQNTKTVLNQIEYLLSGLPIDDIRFKAAEQGARVGLELSDLYSSKEPLTFKVRCDDPSRDLKISVTSVTSGLEGETVKIVSPKDEEWMKIEIPPVTTGTYRLSVDGNGIEKVQDLFVVTEDDDT